MSKNWNGLSFRPETEVEDPRLEVQESYRSDYSPRNKDTSKTRCGLSDANVTLNTTLRVQCTLTDYRSPWSLTPTGVSVSWYLRLFLKPVTPSSLEGTNRYEVRLTVCSYGSSVW